MSPFSLQLAVNLLALIRRLYFHSITMKRYHVKVKFYLELNGVVFIIRCSILVFHCSFVQRNFQPVGDFKLYERPLLLKCTYLFLGDTWVILKHKAK